jgi:hypothetical protein
MPFPGIAAACRCCAEKGCTHWTRRWSSRRRVTQGWGFSWCAAFPLAFAASRTKTLPKRGFVALDLRFSCYLTATLTAKGFRDSHTVAGRYIGVCTQLSGPLLRRVLYCLLLLAPAHALL